MEIDRERCERPLADRLRAFVEDHTDRPYTPVYIEVTGHLLDGKPGGFAADYDGVFYLEEVLRMDAVVPENSPVPSNSMLQNRTVAGFTQ